MNCPDCQTQQVLRNGKTNLQDGSVVQKYLCKSCGRQFNDRTGTPMARLRTPSVIVCAALNVRIEGLGIRATGRSFGKSHSTISRWEQRLAQQSAQWSPPAPQGADVTVEGDELYTRACCEPSPPMSLKGGRFISSNERVATGLGHKRGKRSQPSSAPGTQSAWDWAKPAQYIRWFTDGERRYGKTLWKLASVNLKAREAHRDYHRRKVWRQGLEVAMKIKASQGQRRVEWVYVEHPFTAISAASEVHANHNEALSSCPQTTL